MTASKLAGVSLIAFLSAWGPAARADDTAIARADRYFKDGRRAAERGDFAQACKLFDESFRLDPGVGTLINLGNCADHLGDLDRAYGYYRTAAARMTEGDDRLPRVRERIDSIDQRAAKIALRLDDDAPEGTVITVDGTVDPRRRRGSVDEDNPPLHLAKGAHIILVTAVGYRGARYNVEVGEGEIRALRVSPGTPLEAVLPTSGVVAPEPVRASWTRPVGIATLGLGVASIWVGSLAGLMAIGRRDVQRASCDQRGCTQVGVDAAHDGSTWADVSTTTFIAGGVLAALGVTLLAVPLASKKAVSARVGVAGNGVIVIGRFP